MDASIMGSAKNFKGRENGDSRFAVQNTHHEGHEVRWVEDRSWKIEDGKFFLRSSILDPPSSNPLCPGPERSGAREFIGSAIQNPKAVPQTKIQNTPGRVPSLLNPNG
jgi:hypothetical protein